MDQQNNVQPAAEAPKTLEGYFTERRDTWNSFIAELNGDLKDIANLPTLLNRVFAARQDATEQYFYVLNSYASKNRVYKQNRANLFNSYKVGKNIRYSSDGAINGQIDSDLADAIYEMTLISNHAEFMKETVKTIDSLIYAINNRIKLEELIRGVK